MRTIFKSRKVLSLLAATVVAIGTLFTASACDKAPTVTGIEVTTAPTKVAYVLGQTFDPAGMVVSKLLSNDTKVALDSAEYTYSPDGALKLSDKKVTVSYKDGEDTYQCTQNITVTNNVASVEIKSNPNKTEYLTGEYFDPAGMTIQATLEDGTKGDVIDVTADSVDYKTSVLTASDSHFAMNYGGCAFYLDMTVKCGAFMEAEAGLIVAAGVSVEAAPNKVAIEADLNNAYCVNGEGTPSVRGIDKGLTKVGDDGKTYSITESRVDVRNYIFDPADTEYTYEDFCATGGGNHSSFVAHSNILQFDRDGGGSVMYSLTADKAGSVNFTLRMSVSDPDNSSVAVETKLNEVLEITVNGEKVNIADSVVLPAVDFSAKKAYNPSTTDLSTLGDYKGTFDGKTVRTKYYWQNVTVPLGMAEGGNSVIIKSLINTKKDMLIDSVTFDGDADKVSLFNTSEFKPTVISAKLKVEEVEGTEKVLMGVIVKSNAIGYNDDACMTVLGLTTVKSVDNATNNWSIHGGSLDNQAGGGNDPWTNGVYDGGLGYSDTSLSYKHSMSYKLGGVVRVDKITEGDYEGCFCVWMDATIPADSKLGTEPENNRYQGAWRFYNLSYGALYENSEPEEAILRDGVEVTAELGGFCYQIYCDIRDDNNSFNGGQLMLIVQAGSFEGDNARNLLGRRRLSHLTENDPVPEN